MPKGSESYFGVALGQALAGGAGHISDALRRKYEMQRQMELETRQQRQQDIGTQATFAAKSIRYDPSQPMDPAIFDTVISEAQQRANLERRSTEADISYKQAQAQFLKAKPAPLSKAQTAVDVAFGKDYAAYVAGGGFADTMSQISSLEDVLDKLKSGKENLTGLRVGVTPEFARPYVNPASLGAQQQVEQSVQRTLKKTLGGQFTEREGRLFMERGYDIRLPMKENAKKLERQIGMLKSMAEAKQAAVDYYEANDTLEGYKGRIFTLQDGEPKPIKATEKNIGVSTGQPQPAASPEAAASILPGLSTEESEEFKRLDQKFGGR